MQKLSKESRRQIIVVSLTSFLADVSSEMIFNLLPLFLANVLGVGTGVIGLIDGIAETTASLLKVFSGWLSDRLRVSLGGLPQPFRRFLPIMLLFTLGNSSDSFLILRAQERGLSIPGILLMLIAFNIIYASAAGPLGALSDRLGRRRVIIGGWLVYGMIYLGFGFAVETWQIVTLYALYGLYYGATDGVARALVGDLVPEAQRGTAYGVFNAAVGIAVLPASVLAGILWQGIGPLHSVEPGAPFISASVR